MHAAYDICFHNMQVTRHAYHKHTCCCYHHTVMCLFTVDIAQRDVLTNPPPPIDTHAHIRSNPGLHTADMCFPSSTFP